MEIVKREPEAERLDSANWLSKKIKPKIFNCEHKEKDWLNQRYEEAKKMLRSYIFTTVKDKNIDALRESLIAKKPQTGD